VSGLDDRELQRLVDEFQAGSDGAFLTIWGHYKGLLWWAVRQAEAEHPLCPDQREDAFMEATRAVVAEARKRRPIAWQKGLIGTIALRSAKRFVRHESQHKGPQIQSLGGV
jgi:hypothetical protein